MKYVYDEDGVAFYYFLLMLIALYVVPTTFYAVFPKKTGANQKLVQCSCQGCQDKRAALKATKKDSSGSLLPRRPSLLIGWLLFAFLLRVVWNSKMENKLYDPFEVLNISPGATEQQIRRSYKILSLKWHPDKAKDNKEIANEKFLEITKAYKTLTDDKARKNWEDYGNPDGQRMFSLGIALPAWIVESHNRILILALYGLAFGIGLPLAVSRWWLSAKKYTKDRILHSSMGMFYQEMKEDMTLKKLVSLMCCSFEFRDEVPSRPTDEAAIAELAKFIEKEGDKYVSETYENPKRCTTPSSIKAHILLFAHFHRIPVKNADLASDQSKIVEKSFKIANGMLQIALARGWFMASLNCISLSQYLIQAVWEGQSPLLQLPSVDRELIKQNKGKKIKTVRDFYESEESERRSFVHAISDAEYNNLVKISATMPEIEIESVEFKVLGQEAITTEGIITCLIKLRLRYPGDKPSVQSKPVEAAKPAAAEGSAEKDSSAAEKDADAFEFDEDGNLLDAPKKTLSVLDSAAVSCHPVHAPRFKMDKRPYWWVMLVTKSLSGMVMTPIKVSDLVDTKTVTVQFAAPSRPGKIDLTVLIRSDCLIGVDVQREASFTVVPISSIKQSTEEVWDISDDEEETVAPFGSED